MPSSNGSKPLKRLSLGQKRILAADAVDWIGALGSRRRPIPLPDFAAEVENAEKSIQQELHSNRLKFQGYDVVMALYQIYDLVQHFERRRKLPKEMRGPLGGFLAAMKSGRLKNLRNAFVHYADDIAGVTTRKQRAKRGEDTWTQHRARPADEVIVKAATREVYKASLYSFGAKFNEDGIMGVAIRGQSYMLMDAVNSALELGPPLSRFAGRRLLTL